MERGESVDLVGEGVDDASRVNPEDSNLGKFLKGFE